MIDGTLLVFPECERCVRLIRNYVDATHAVAEMDALDTYCVHLVKDHGMKAHAVTKLTGMASGSAADLLDDVLTGWLS